MKKRIFIIFLSLCVLFSSLYIVLSLSKEEMRISELNSISDYVILASTYKTRCAYGKENNELKQIKSYVKNGKFYTEVYVDCPVSESIGEIITIETTENYFEKEGSFVLFINKVNNEEKVYTTVKGKCGIIKFENGRAKPLDKSVKVDTVDLLWNWAYLNSNEKQKEYLTSNGIICYSYNISEIYNTTESQ